MMPFYSFAAPGKVPRKKGDSHFITYRKIAWGIK